MDNTNAQFIGILAGILNILAFSIILTQVHITKNTDNLSYSWIFLIMTSQLLFILYGIIRGAYGIYIPSIIFILGVSYILYIKINYSENKKIDKEFWHFNIY